MAEGGQQQMELMFSFYERLHRKAPGSESSTRKALSLLTEIPSDPRIVEFGCGSGAAALVLAQAMECNVTAVDVHQPFLDELDARAVRAGLADRIRTVRADMAEPPFPDGSFDLVWSEGAIYIAGFEKGLLRWRRLLAPKGLVAVTEATWLTMQPPAEAAKFFEAEYPTMTTIEENMAMLRSTGFDPITHFILPPEDWSDAYYMPLQEQLVLFRDQHARNEDAQAFADDLQREIDVWRDFGESYGYVFYLARAC